MAGIYLHIPFCKQACHYCDFHFSTGLHDLPSMVESMIREIVIQKGFLMEPLQTIYFGGGTPSLLPAGTLEALMEAIHNTFEVAPAPEVTLEANPDDLTAEKLLEFCSTGINRLSIGVQSFDDDILRYLNRAHTARAALDSLRKATDAGFSNISLDLIYAISGLTLDHWRRTIDTALQFQPAHISTYALTIEEKTVFGNLKSKGKLSLVDEESVAQQYEALLAMMEDAGFDGYEISNFSRPGMHSRHNSSYWLQTPYLGIGPSAHSYDGAMRFFNVRNNAHYIKSLREGILARETEVLSSKDKINEYILTRLRTKWGCDLDFLRETLGDDLLQRRGTYVFQQQEAGLLSVKSGVLFLSVKGRLLADKITEDLMIDAS